VFVPHPECIPGYGNSSAGTYGDFVNMVDAAVGEVTKQLEDLGLAENSLVIFTSDNGPFWTPELIEKHGHRAAGPLRGMKADVWEGGHRIPFIVRYPTRIRAGSITSATTTLTNLMATCADLLHVELEPNEGEDSFSILPVLFDEQETVFGQDAVIHHSSRGFFAIRKGDWKLIQGRGSGGFSDPQIYLPKAGEARGQLYNLKEDFQELENLYNSAPDKVIELTTLLEEIKQ